MVKSEGSIVILSNLRGVLRDRISLGDVSGAVASCQEAIANKSISIKDLYLECLAPLMAGVGEEWQKQQLPVWREHVASAICRDIIGAMAPEISRTALPSNGKIVILACPPEEQHDIGLRIIADLFRLRGWQAYFLGADVPAREIIASIIDTGADTAVLSAATHFHLVSVNNIAVEIAAAVPDVRILLTGPAYKNMSTGSPQGEILNPEEIS